MNMTGTLQIFSKFTVLHSQYQDAIDTIMTSMQTTAECGEPSCPMLMGVSGTGKSSICTRLVQLLGPPTPMSKVEGLVASLPCLYLELPARPTINSVAAAILEALKVSAGGSGPSLERRILTILKSRETQLVILDEFQNFANKGAEKTKAETCNWIKYMLNQSRITFLLSGEPVNNSIITPLAQLSARYPYRINLSHLTYSADPNSEFRTILAMLSAEIVKLGKFHSYLFLADEHMSAAMYMASGGNMRCIRRILHGAFKSALTRGDGTLINMDFSTTVEKLDLSARIQKETNPFLISTQQIFKAISE